jgi:Flp pilus assembly protein TadG
MRRNRLSRRRRGATAVELAVVLIIFLTLVFGMLDLGLGVLRYHVLAQSSRQIARQAIVHGSLATKLGTWGPTSYTGTGASSDGVGEALRPNLAKFDPSEVNVQVEWIDGGNDPDQRVRVTVTSPYKPIMTFVFGNPTFTIRATSTMPIAH